MSSSDNSDSPSPVYSDSSALTSPASPLSPVIEEEKKYQLPEATTSNTFGNLGPLLRFRFRNHPLFEPALVNEIQDYVDVDTARFENLKEYYGDDSFFIDPHIPILPENDPLYHLLGRNYESTADVQTQFKYVLDRFYRDNLNTRYRDPSVVDDLVDLIHKFVEIYDNADRQVLGRVLQRFTITNELREDVKNALYGILDEWGYEWEIPDYMRRR
jgi:hypothetical protein